MLCPLGKHCMAWPQGYAGDYKIMLNLYHKQAPQDDDIGNWTVSDVVHSCMRQLPLVSVVKKRYAACVDVISSQYATHHQAFPSLGPTFRVCSIASGPAIEMFQFFQKTNRPKVHFTLLDQDADAHAHIAGKLLGVGLPAAVRQIRANAVRAAKRGTPLGEFDFIYCIGMFDYIPDHLVVACLKWFNQNLRPLRGGSPPPAVYVGNVIPEHAQYGSLMGKYLNWPLIHRSMDQLHALCSEAGFGNFRVEVHSGSQAYILADKVRELATRRPRRAML